MAEDSKLSELRNKIDAIDRELLQLLAARSEIVHAVGAHKGDNQGNNFIRSGREARMLRELTEAGAGKFPQPAIRALWRGIIAASLAMESGLKVALPANLSLGRVIAATEYFGSFTAFKEYADDNDIIAAIDSQTVGVFLLDTGWWLQLGEAGHNNLKIFARLPYGLFAVARLHTEESGDDRTLAITHADNMQGEVVATHGKVKLIELAGYLPTVPGAVVIGHYGV